MPWCTTCTKPSKQVGCLAASHQELVDVHAGINCNLPAKIVVKLLLLEAAWCMVCQELGQPLEPGK